MFDTSTGIGNRGRTVLLAAVGGEGHAQAPDAAEHRTQLAAEHAVDSALADSFPASDPPSWTSGIATPPPPQRPARDAPAVTTAPGDPEGAVARKT